MTPRWSPHEEELAAIGVGALVAGLMLAAFILLTGCADRRAVVTAANAQREVGVVAAQVLHDVCTVGYERASTQAEIDRLDALGCVKAAHALRTYRRAHALEVSVLLAYEAGRCTSLVSQAPRECDLAGAALDVVRAAQRSEEHTS